MKKVFYLLAILLAGNILVTSCNDDEPGPNGNYGDPTIRPAIQIASFYSKSDPTKVYDLTIDAGAPTDTTYEIPEMKATYCVYKPVVIPAEMDTFVMRLKTNSRWSSSTPTKTGLFILNGVGNGDADATFRVTRNTSKANDRTRYMYFYSNDSSTMHKVTIVQSKTVE